MKKIILAFDSFKGSVTSMQAADIAGEAILKECPYCEIVKFSVADGGEGTTDAICINMDVNYVICEVHDPLMNPMRVKYAISNDGETAVMEMAAASGLPLVPEELRNPMNTSSYGTGEMIKDAMNRGCSNIIIGIGGSATNDAGTGLLSALGYRFLDANNRVLEPVGRNLSRIYSIDETRKHPLLEDVTFTIVCDVVNPMYGESGAAYVFGPQKGASTMDIKALDAGLRHYSELIRDIKGIDISLIEGAGAAGGMGGGLLPFLNAVLKSGIDTILDAQGFSESLNGAGLVITGEGKLDAQTCMGKALNGILNRAKAKNIPVIAIGGSVDDADKLNEMGFTAVYPIQPGPVSLEQAMDTGFAVENIRRTIIQIIRTIKLSMVGCAYEDVDVL